MIYEMRQTSHRKYYLRAANYLSKLNLSPNTWTMIGFFMGIFMAVMIYYKSYFWAMVFGLIMACCDIMDGEIAKLKNNTSPFGRLLDVTVDKYVEGFVGLAAGLSMPQVLLPSLVWGGLSIWGSVLISVVSNVGGILSKKKPFKLVGRGDRGLLILLGLLLGMIKPVYFSYCIVLITVLSHLSVVILLVEYSFILKKEAKPVPQQHQGEKVSSISSVESRECVSVG